MPYFKGILYCKPFTGLLACLKPIDWHLLPFSSYMSSIDPFNLS